jgi:PAS domain S-box-containing protein
LSDKTALESELFMTQFHNAKEQAQIAQIETVLKDLGFSNRETAIYLTLCKIKKATPADVSKASGMERSDTYRILDNLVAKGFMIKILEKPTQYAIAPPEKAFMRSLEEKRKDLVALECQVEESSKILMEYIGKSDAKSNSGRFEVVQSSKFVYDRLSEMLCPDRCHKEVLFYGTEKSPGKILFNIGEDAAQLLKRKVDLKFLVPITIGNLQDVKKLSRYADIRHLDQTAGRVIIVDRKESMLIYSASGDENYRDELGLWLNNAQFSATQAEMFDAQWKLATEFHNKIKELEERRPANRSFKSIKQLTEENAAVVFTVNDRGKITYISHSVSDYLASAIDVFVKGLCTGELTKFSYPEDQEKIADVWEKANQGFSGKEEFRTILAGGGIRWWSLSWLPIKDKKGSVETIRVDLKDISGSKKLELVELALVESEERLVKSQEIAHVGSWELDLATNRIYCSDEVYRIFGLDSDDVQTTYENFLKYVHPEESSIVDEAYKRSLIEGTDFDFEHRIVRSDSTVRWVHEKCENIQDETGKVVRSIGMVQDITEQKEAEKNLLRLNEALAESEARFRKQFEEATDAIILADIETGLISDCNYAATQLTGFSRDELIGKSQKSVHPDQSRSFNYHLKSPEKPVIQEILTKSGEIRDVVIKAAVIDLKGRKIMQGIFRDVTEENKAQEAIRQTKLNYETFFDSIDDFLYVLDMQGQILQINNTVARRLSYNREELIGQSILMVHPPQLREEALAIVQAMIAGKKDYCPIPVITKDGHLIPVETRVTKGEWNGRPVLFGVSKDISQLKLSESKFSQAFNATAVLMALSEEQSGDFIDVNEAFLKTLGYSREEVIGQNAKTLKIFGLPMERERAINILHQTGKVRNLKVQIRTKTGALLTGLFSVDYITVGQVPYLLTTMVDITYQNKC